MIPKNTLPEAVIFPSGSGPSSGAVSLLSLNSRAAAYLHKLPTATADGDRTADMRR